MYCMTITWKGYLPGASPCYDILSNQSLGGTSLIMGVGECVAILAIHRPSPHRGVFLVCLISHGPKRMLVAMLYAPRTLREPPLIVITFS